MHFGNLVVDLDWNKQNWLLKFGELRLWSEQISNETSSKVKPTKLMKLLVRWFTKTSLASERTRAQSLDTLLELDLS